MIRMRAGMAGLVAAVASVTGLSLGAAPVPAPINTTGPQQPIPFGTITGSVVDGGGKPVAGAIVVLLHHRRHAAGTQVGTGQAGAAPAGQRHLYRETVSDANGRFNFVRVAPGQHVLMAHKLEVGRGHMGQQVQAGGADNVTITLAHHGGTKNAER